jgi:tetratricopeptide (TPR) repeat protein
VRRRFASALAERVPLGGGALTSGKALTRALRRAGVTRETAADAATLVAELDAAAFGAAEPATAAPPDARAEEVLARVEAEARHRYAPPLWGWLLLVAATGVIGGGALAAGRGEVARAAEAFSGGVRLYEARRYEQASAAFGEVTRLAPRSVDAWANRGTAAWAASDTAGAAEGWQRAVRLDPTAADVRERLDLLPGTQLGGAAWVPPASVSLAAAAALALWAAACGWAAWRAWRRRAAVATGPALLAAAAAACAALAWVGEHARTARDLDVVREGGESRVSPALGAEPGPSLREGEVVRVLARREAWARVAVEGDREAWVAAERLAPLRAD